MMRLCLFLVGGEAADGWMLRIDAQKRNTDTQTDRHDTDGARERDGNQQHTQQQHSAVQSHRWSLSSFWTSHGDVQTSLCITDIFLIAGFFCGPLSHRWKAARQTGWMEWMARWQGMSSVTVTLFGILILSQA